MYAGGRRYRACGIQAVDATREDGHVHPRGAYRAAQQLRPRECGRTRQEINPGALALLGEQGLACVSFFMLYRNFLFFSVNSGLGVSVDGIVCLSDASRSVTACKVIVQLHDVKGVLSCVPPVSSCLGVVASLARLALALTPQTVYNYPVLREALNLMSQPPSNERKGRVGGHEFPLLLMRTVIVAMTTFPELKNFVATIVLPRLVQQKVNQSWFGVLSLTKTHH